MLNWSDERYIRLYVRDTVETAVWPWQARALWPWLLARCSRDGILELGKHGTDGLAVVTRLPADVVAVGLDGLLADGCVVRDGTRLVVRNFVVAQESPASAAKRAKEYRDRQRESESVTERDAVVTKRDDSSRGVTERHGANDSSLCAVPFRAVPSHTNPPPTPSDAGAPAPAPPFALEQEVLPERKRRAPRERVLSKTSLEVQAFIASDDGSGVTYPPSSFDSLERLLKKNLLTHDDALLLFRYAAKNNWCLNNALMNPVVLLREERWPALLAQAKATRRTNPVVRDGTERRVHNVAEALAIE